MEATLSDIDEVVYAFGEYRFFPNRQLLFRGATPVRIGSRALDLLKILVERRGELVSKSDLIRFAWPDTFVHEDNLKVNIGTLRRALSQERAELPYITTVPGRGYRFVATAHIEVNLARELKAPSTNQSNRALPALPVMVGRDNDIAKITKDVEQHGFVTIVGPAGVGKTTVAIASARQLTKRFPDGAYFVDLAAINDPQLLLATIASSLGSGDGVVDLLVGITDALRNVEKLIILDNCEHVLPTASLVAEKICSILPGIGIIATSREPLCSKTESVYRLAPLEFPESDVPLGAPEAMTFSAIALFVARAAEATGYQLTDIDAPFIASICRRLDGIPLAIELAAPRLITSDLPDLVQHLNQSFELLNYGTRTAPLRHQALQATLDWSYRLLSDSEAALLRLLSVFAGAFTYEDVLDIASEVRLSSSEIATSLESLAAKSLVAETANGSSLKYRLLYATRSYAGERLRATGEQRSAFEGHARSLLRVFETAETEWKWREREAWLAHYGQRANDLRKAIDWAFSDGGDAAIGIRLTVASIPLWDELSSVAESRQRARTALDAVTKTECAPELQMKLAAAYARGFLMSERVEPEAEAACLDSVRLARINGDTDYQLRSLWNLIVLHSFSGRHDDVLESLDEFDAIAAKDSSAGPSGARFRHMAQFYRGNIVSAHGNLQQLAEEQDVLDQRSQISRFQVDPYVMIRFSLAFVSWVRGDVVEAKRMAAIAVNSATTIKHLVSQSAAISLASLPISLWTGNLEEAERHLALLVDNLNQKSLAIWTPLSHFFGAAIRHKRGYDDAVDQMHVAVDEILASRFLIRAPFYLSMLAEAALERGQVELARSSIFDAFARAKQQNEVWCQPEILRVLGLVELRLGRETNAEAAQLKAVELAKEIGALLFQLRVANDISFRWARNGRISAAVTLLDPICRQFPPDLTANEIVRARELLEHLRAEKTPTI
jgi:predicted ATPase/DNA-binding winged helix-turn-helix (wHTH) protein